MKSVCLAAALLLPLTLPQAVGAQTPAPVYGVLEAADPLQSGVAGSAANLVGYTIKHYDNTIEYVTPRNRSGWNAAAVYSVGESPYNSSINRAYAATIGYSRGMAYLSLTHQRKDNPVDAEATTPPADLSARNTLAAANVNFGRFIGYAAYGHSRGDASAPWDLSNPYGAVAQNTPVSNSRDVLFGIAVPMGATTWLASYIHKDDRSILNRDANQLAFGASYALSRHTDFYAAYAKIQYHSGADAAAFSLGRADSAFNIGLRHAF